jgi:hypothetical protein
MVMPHLEVSHRYFKVNGNKVIIVATHEEEPTSKSHGSYVDADVEGEVSQSYLPTNLPTSKSIKLKDFFKKC